MATSKMDVGDAWTGVFLNKGLDEVPPSPSQDVLV